MEDQNNELTNTQNEPQPTTAETQNANPPKPTTHRRSRKKKNEKPTEAEAIEKMEALKAEYEKWKAIKEQAFKDELLHILEVNEIKTINDLQSVFHDMKAYRAAKATNADTPTNAQPQQIATDHASNFSRIYENTYRLF